MADMMETRQVGGLCAFKRLYGRGTKRNSWGGCSCSVVVQTNKSGTVWGVVGPTIQRTE